MVKIGTSLVLELIERGEMERYRCKIIEQAGSFLYVDYPINETTGRTGIFEKDTEFLANFIGEDGSIYQFATVLKRKEKLNIPALIFNYPGDKELKRIQRREYVRIDSTNDVAVHDPHRLFAPFTSMTSNISGGGLSIILPETCNVKKGAELEVWIVLRFESGETDYIHAEGKAIRVTEGKEGKKPILAIKFSRIEDRDRQSIIRHCFDRQLKERRKK